MITKASSMLMGQQVGPDGYPVKQDDILTRSAKGVVGGYAGGIVGAGAAGLVQRRPGSSIFKAPGKFAKAMTVAGALAGISAGAKVTPDSFRQGQ